MFAGYLLKVMRRSSAWHRSSCYFPNEAYWNRGACSLWTQNFTCKYGKFQKKTFRKWNLIKSGLKLIKFIQVNDITVNLDWNVLMSIQYSPQHVKLIIDQAISLQNPFAFTLHTLASIDGNKVIRGKCCRSNSRLLSQTNIYLNCLSSAKSSNVNRKRSRES